MCVGNISIMNHAELGQLREIELVPTDGIQVFANFGQLYMNYLSMQIHQLLLPLAFSCVLSLLMENI